MCEIKIRTLTSIHIGSGNFLQKNYDYVVTHMKSTDKKYIRILDDKKIFDLIGREHLQDWVTSIERGEDTKEMIKRFSPQTKPNDYSKRKIECFARQIGDSSSLKECIHDGRGLPYIPGSSIKGAIRTAVVASLVKNIPNIESLLSDRISSSPIEKMLFGDDPKTDIFKFIRTSDAFFEPEGEIVIRLINLNIRDHHSDLIDDSKSQLVEAIRPEETSSFRLTIDMDKYRFSKSKNANMGTLNEQFDSVQKLFILINEHTRNLVREEIKRGQECDKTGTEDYIEKMETISNEIDTCGEGYECVMRIGHASGWRFITGAWTEKWEDFYPRIVSAARPNNNKYYSRYVFPKTRRIDQDNDILGFIKMSVEQ